MEEAPVPIFSTPKELNSSENLLESKEYKIEKDNYNYDIVIGKTKDNIIIRCLYYELKFNNNDLSTLTKIVYNSLDDSYEFIKNSFEYKKILIKDITKAKIILVINTYDVFK